KASAESGVGQLRGKRRVRHTYFIRHVPPVQLLEYLVLIYYQQLVLVIGPEKLVDTNRPILTQFRLYRPHLYTITCSYMGLPDRPALAPEVLVPERIALPHILYRQKHYYRYGNCTCHWHVDA